MDLWVNKVKVHYFKGTRDGDGVIEFISLLKNVENHLAFFSGESQFAQPTGSIAAAAVVVTVPIIIMVLIFQRRIVAGLTSGAVKG